DDFLDHLAFGFMQSPLGFTHLDQGLELLIANLRSDPQFRGRKPVNHDRARAFQKMPDAVEQWHHDLEREDPERRDAVGGGKGEQFWNQIAEHNHEREDRQGRDPCWEVSNQGTFPDENEAQDDQRHIYDRVAKEQNTQHSPGIVAKAAKEFRERRMLVFEPLNLMALERKERRFQARE